MTNEDPRPQFDWYLRDEDSKPICNFIPKVLGAIEVKGDLNSKFFVRLKLYFEEGESEEISLLFSELDKVDWFEIDRRCIINPNYPKAAKYLGNLIRTGLNKVPTVTKYRLDRLGIHRIDGKVFYCAGDRVISRSSDSDSMSNIELGELPFRLDIDQGLTKREAFDGMREFIGLSPELGRVLVAYTISGFVRSAFNEAGCIPRFVLVVVGKSGMFKSHYVPHLVQLYNRGDEIRADTRFNSTFRFMEDTLCSYRDCTAIVDDLHTAESKSIQRINENTFEEFLRRVGDNTGRGHKEGSESIQNEFGGNVLFIGEYIIGKESSIPRELIVHITKRPDGKIFDKYQREKPLLVSTFYYYFLQWYVDRFEEICAEISARLTAFRADSVNSEIHGRLGDARFILKTSYMLLLAFCKESGVISSEDAKDEYYNFDAQIARLILEQQARYKSRSENMDYLKLIRKLYKSRRIRIASSDKAYDTGKHDGLIHYKCLCLRRETLDKLLCEVYPNTNIKEVIESLTNMQALKRDKHTGKFIIKINSKNKSVKGKCFYGIWLYMLE